MQIRRLPIGERDSEVLRCNVWHAMVKTQKKRVSVAAKQSKGGGRKNSYPKTGVVTMSMAFADGRGD